MASQIAKEWLKAVYLDIQAIEYLLGNEHLTPIASFHAQQAIEKSFKALIEYKRQNIPKKHNLFALYSLIENDIKIEDEKTMFKINELYMDARYPGDLGLLPDGKPSLEDAKRVL
ncbi:HEPN domain-containing protein [Nitratiruptor tergarcus]|uniref:HEPN domain-containing protein n=1 Tax=Nitratiruptor tergarcus DSM 16512 TaxID=1069081 RepID=A0A1W1WUT7_9BACT|nr:HEPN domain-containing protein [Nitratiruptor tergarcus]SMC09493.1 HEPN domain-containing protein [Nitratiruptor tergarcus DSM 16512]